MTASEVDIPDSAEKAHRCEGTRSLAKALLRMEIEVRNSSDYPLRFYTAGDNRESK